MVSKMGQFIKIRTLEETEGKASDYSLYSAKPMNSKETIIAESEKHQVLSKYTAFICVEKEISD